jgi:hypothetical protein
VKAEERRTRDEASEEGKELDYADHRKLFGFYSKCNRKPLEDFKQGVA